MTSDLWKSVIMITSGIEHSLNSMECVQDFDSITDKDYSLKNTFEISNPSLDEFSCCEFIDYAPKIFGLIRSYNGISKDEYLESLGTSTLNRILSGNIDSFKGLSSAGKSGSFFFSTFDNKYFVKTIPAREFDVAVEILREYMRFLNSCQVDSGVSNTLTMK